MTFDYENLPGFNWSTDLIDNDPLTSRGSCRASGI